MASDRETTIRTGIHQIRLASVHGECEEGVESEENSLFNHLVPGSIRRDYKVIGENEREEKWTPKKYMTQRAERRQTRRREREREKSLKIDAECSDMHNPVRIIWKTTCSIA